MADMNLLGLYLDLKARRQQEEEFRQRSQMAEKQQRQQNFMQVLELTKTDPKTATSALRMFIPDYTSDEEQFIEGVAKVQQKKAKADELAKTQRTRGFREIAEGGAAEIRAGRDPSQYFQLQHELGGIPDPELLDPALARAYAIAQGAEGLQEQDLEQLRATTGIQRRSQIAHSAAIEAQQRTYKSFALLDKDSGEIRTVVGFDKYQRLLAENPNFIEIQTPGLTAVKPSDLSSKGRSQVAKLEDSVSNQYASLARARSVRDLMDTNPELFGFSGELTAAVRGLVGTSGDIGKMPIRAIRDSALAKRLDEMRKGYEEDLIGRREAGKIEPEANQYFSKVFRNPNAGAIDFLSAAQVYDAARLFDPTGRISDNDYKAAQKGVGIRGYTPTLDVERAKARQDAYLDDLGSTIESELKRLERIGKSGVTSTISREDLPLLEGRGAPEGPAVKLTPEQQAEVNRILREVGP